MNTDLVRHFVCTISDLKQDILFRQSDWQYERQTDTFDIMHDMWNPARM